jgi:hypothetical protein
MCLVGEPLERSGAVPHSGDGSNPSHVWLQRLGWSGSDPFFCLVGGTKYGMDGSFNTVNGSHMSQSVEVSGSHMSCIFFLLIPHWILSSRIRSPAPPAWAIPSSWAWASPAPPAWASPAAGLDRGGAGRTPRRCPGRTPPPAWVSSARS